MQESIKCTQSSKLRDHAMLDAGVKASGRRRPRLTPASHANRIGRFDCAITDTMALRLVNLYHYNSI